MHVHATSPDGEAKFWLEPVVALAENDGLPAKEIKVLQKLVEEKRNEIIEAWKKHFRN